MKERTQTQIVAYLFIFPAVFLVGTLLLNPMVQNIYYSFFTWDMVSKPVFIGFGNYINLLGDTNFIRSFVNTVIWVVFTLAVPVLGGLIIAIFIRGLRGERIFKSIIFLPLAISFVSTGIIWTNMFNFNSGIINGFLSLFAGRDVEIAWLTTVPLNTVAMLISWSWQQTGNYMVLFLMGLTTIPQEPVEAAIIDGASAWQTFRNITVPMLQPITTVVIGQAMVNSFKAFDLIYVITRGGPYRSSETLAVTMFRESFSMFRMGYGASVAVVLSAIIILISGTYVRKQISKDSLHY